MQLLVCLTLLCTQGIADLTLERLIVVSRHGIRVPFPPAHGANNYSMDDREWYTDAKQWGAEDVAYLTDHGAKVLEQMGTYFRRSLQKFLPAGCDGLNTITIYADNDETKRDIKTALNFFSGLYPGCSPTVNSDPKYVTNLFNQGQLNVSSECSGPTRQEILGQIGGDPKRLSEVYEESIEKVSKGINCCKPVVCQYPNNPTDPTDPTDPANPANLKSIDSRNIRSNRNKRSRFRTNLTPKGSNGCNLMNIPTYWKGLFYQYYEGPYFTADGLTEYLQLLYLNAMDYTKTTSLTAQDIETLISLHQGNMQRTSNMWARRSYGSQLLAHILSTVTEVVTGVSNPALLSKPSDKFIYYAGHDINIYFLRGFLRLNWLSWSFNPNEAPPGGMLSFEVMSDDCQTGKCYHVKCYFTSASYDQQRNLDVSLDNPPDRTYVSIPTCSHGPEGSCPYTDFKALLLSAMDPKCVVNITTV